MAALDSSIGEHTALLAALAAHPVCARLLVEEHWGERDVRIAVSAASGAGPVVELLCPAPAELGPGDGAGSWDAVVVEGGRRRLWHGPSAACPGSEVAAFVRDLLELPPPALRRRWPPAG
jgi:hypothetical protein